MTLSVEAKGAQLSYQWFKNDVSITGATGATLDFPQLAAGDAGAYHVVVTNPAGQAASDMVQVTLGDLPSKLKQYQAAVEAESSLVSLYSFDGLTAKDTEQAHHGALQGGARFGDGIGGGAGKALLLDGAGWVNLDQVKAFDFLDGSGTVEAWIRADWTASPGYNPACDLRRPQWQPGELECAHGSRQNCRRPVERFHLPTASARWHWHPLASPRGGL